MNSLDKKLYELFARKELSEGCLVTEKTKFNSGIYKIYGTYFDEKEYMLLITNGFSRGAINISSKEFAELKEYKEGKLKIKRGYTILGHEPQLHDVFRVAKERKQPLDIVLYYFDEPSLKMYDCHTYKEEDKIIKGYNPTKSLLNQSDETKSALISLFS